MRGSILFIGPSGTGKSLAMLNYVKNINPQKVLVLNDKTRLAKEQKFISVDWDFDFKILKNGVLICEDLVCLSGKQLALLGTFVNVLRRHNNNTCLLVTHALRGNNIYSLLQQMNYFVFTSARSNIQNWNVVCSIFKLDNDIRNRGEEFFLKSPGKFYTLVLDTAKSSIQIFTPDYKPSQITQLTQPKLSTKEILEKFALVFKGCKRESQMYSLANFLVGNLPREMEIKADLSIIIPSSKPIRISLVDYIQLLTSPKATVNKPMTLVHSYFCRQMIIPNLLIENVVLKNK
jgi:hypothetical protein